MRISPNDFSKEHKWVDHHRLPTRGPNPTLFLFLSEDQVSTFRPKIGLSSNMFYNAYFINPEGNRPRSTTLAPGPAYDGSFGFWEIDQQRMPGMYGLQIPPFLRPPGYTYLYLHFSGARPHYLEIHGIDHDPYDSFALGLTTWIRSTCHENLTSGLRKSMPSTLRPFLQEWFESHK